MYHIKPDKRSKTSASMLYKALAACLKEKPFEEISITEVVTQSSNSRSTFYRNFDELVDILYWKCDRQFAEVLQGFAAEGIHENLGLLEYVFAYWQEHSEVLEILLSIKRTDIIYECFTKNSVPVMELLRERVHLPQEQESYFMAVRIGVFVGVVKTWLQNGKKESAHQLSVMLGEQLQQMTAGGLIF